MSDPTFTVPLSALVEIGVEPDTGRRYWWCGWMADDRPCQAEGHPVSREAAVAAAVQHLADAHGIEQAGESDTEWHRRMRSLLGKKVVVTIQRQPQIVAEGTLVDFGEDGEVGLRDECGFVHWAWPNLNIAEVTDG